MAHVESYARLVAERAQLPPLTSGDARYWDGQGIASRGMGLIPVSEPVGPAAVPAQTQPVPGYQADPSRMTKSLGLLPLSLAPTIDWATEAACLTFYLHPNLLLPCAHEVVPVATGVLVWVVREEHGECSASAVHPALLVQTASAPLAVACVEVVPRLPADDPLLHHMALVLQAACDTEVLAGRLYAESLATALALHFLRRYAAGKPSAPAVLGGLSPAKLSRTIAHIQAHLENALPLATLAAVVQMSPNHFAHMFKQVTGQTPHHYVLECRIARAKQLLAETDLPLSAIGPQVGCTDQSYFTALFRKHVAMTPKAYRAATQGV